MKKHLLIYSFIALTLFGCEDWLDVNTDPNNPVEVSPDLLLPVGQNYTARWMHQDRYVNHLGNMMMYNWSEAAGFSWYNDEFLYLVNSTFYDQIFDVAYQRALKQYADIKDTDPEVYPAYHGISEIMQAYTYHILTDFYGDIPYTEALERGGNVTPAYDDAEQIYDMLLEQLSAGISLIETAEAAPAAINPGDDDLMFHGNLERWKQFANTVKVRILNRGASAKGNAWVTAGLSEIANQGSGFITEDAMVYPYSTDTNEPLYANEENKQNPYWEDFGWGVDGTATLTHKATAASDYIIDYLESTGDPRIDRLFEEPATGHLGVPQGIVANADTYDPTLVSNIGPGILKSVDMGSIIFTLAEHYFNMAELALNGYSVGGTAQDYYNAGILASFRTLGLSQSDYDDYGAPAVSLQSIMRQKWIATAGLTAEQSWFDWVRTGYPADIPVSQEIENLVRPVRLSYPASEVGVNPNVPAQLDPFTNKQFWAN